MAASIQRQHGEEITITGAGTGPIDGFVDALSRHIGVPLSVDDWQKHGHAIPLLVNMQPAGKYLGEEFYRAGGIPAVVAELIGAGKIVFGGGFERRSQTIFRLVNRVRHKIEHAQSIIGLPAAQCAIRPTAACAPSRAWWPRRICASGGRGRSPPCGG